MEHRITRLKSLLLLSVGAIPSDGTFSRPWLETANSNFFFLFSLLTKVLVKKVRMKRNTGYVIQSFILSLISQGYLIN